MQIIISERCFLCRSIVFCKTYNKCPTSCLKSTCRGQTSKLLANLAGSGCWSESSSNPQRGLHPPLSDPAELDKVTDHHKLLCHSPRDLYLLEALHQLMDKNAVKLVQNLKISGFLQPTLLGSKAKQSFETYSRSKQTKFFPQGGKIQF